MNFIRVESQCHPGSYRWLNVNYIASVDRLIGEKGSATFVLMANGTKYNLTQEVGDEFIERFEGLINRQILEG
ncbi:hypothetical protein [Lyngbya sp. CCY1209]|uniref:hypothetical protein n=1 Tax=Lyngbya sp. CCY1209 TaxID=2886103 RepID=UPI002D1FEF97|nr:hypothetical protein [Lyngbya sp. CCY1209]MEB3884024.1 hypothetical protein [Lyngbya sp. CCY1209]